MVAPRSNAHRPYAGVDAKSFSTGLPVTRAHFIWGETWPSGQKRCASIPKVTGSNPSGGSELTFRSDLLLTAIGLGGSA
jgi:hypothetical protein